MRSQEWKGLGNGKEYTVISNVNLVFCSTPFLIGHLIMTSVVNKAILELTPSSTEEDAKETYDAWAATYEKVSSVINQQTVSLNCWLSQCKGYYTSNYISVLVL